MPRIKTLTEAERRVLEKEREQKSIELERLREYVRIEPEPGGDEVDLVVYEREKNLALVRTLEERIKAIDNALRIAEKGVYGICERCGKPIGKLRLQAFPRATLCVACKQSQERR